MAIYISFVEVNGESTLGAKLISSARTTETVTDGNSTESVAQGREAVLIANDESGTIFAAWGSDPDATAVAQTADTSAGIPIQAGQSALVVVNIGDKINVAAAS